MKLVYHSACYLFCARVHKSAESSRRPSLLLASPFIQCIHWKPLSTVLSIPVPVKYLIYFYGGL
jgi:hypothetical protein